MKKLVLIIALLFSLVAQGETHNCFPQNNRINPISNNKSLTTIAEAEFYHSIKLANEVYGPIFKDQYDAELVIEPKWEDETVNAYAQQFGSRWNVAMFGGLARDPLVTKDGFTAVICHEIGHHVGGAPRKGSSWASNEGQADYFATTKCLRKIYEKDLLSTLEFYSRTDITPDQKIAKKACDDVYPNESDAAVCFRSALAGESLARLLGKLGGNANVLFGKPDATVVAKTNHNHPKGQCRMDTYYQGALCDVDHSVWPSNADAAEGYCSSKSSHEIGLRPLCWFQPKEYGLDR